MTYSETEFRKCLKKIFNDPSIYIKKVADKKVLGHGANTGLPDYLCIVKGITTWYEVKQSATKSTFNLNIISESQYIEFSKIVLIIYI